VHVSMVAELHSNTLCEEGINEFSLSQVLAAEYVMETANNPESPLHIPGLNYGIILI